MKFSNSPLILKILIYSSEERALYYGNHNKSDMIRFEKDLRELEMLKNQIDSKERKLKEELENEDTFREKMEFPI